ncbi:MAG TPA: LuxR C-terminal-related transcriptional regulator [Gammaproteobacteria bacterium]|nr:LuxR C-terminal-related transcriptional regulator [Gammaproteobacteria bacterium]
MDKRREGLLSEARAAYRRHAWRDAFDLFSRADAEAPLDAEDLEPFAWSAALCGRDAELLAALERLHQLNSDAARHEQAARAAFWSGFRLFSLGETGRATAWMQRAQRALERGGDLDCVVKGWLLLPVGLRHLLSGELEQSQAAAARAAEIGERFSDRDLVSFARGLQGRAMIRGGRIAEGLALLDEAMLAAASGELTPLVTGLVYCSVIATCCQIYALDRAWEWTAALARWCDTQPQLVPFSGTCRVHRAELMELNGDWREAVIEAEDAFQRLAETVDREGAAAACYQRGEIYRLRGDLAAAEECYREANRWGREPQPGLALLRLAQGRRDQAAAAIRRVLGATPEPLRRARLLPAFIEIMLAVDSIDEAAAAAEELADTARTFETDVLAAMAAHACGAIELARGDCHAALAALRSSFSTWDKIGAPYIAAKLRVLIARACLRLGDEDGAELELEAARAVFDSLNAAPDLEALAALFRERYAEPRPPPAHRLTPRELEVLRLLADGKTNRAIAEALGLSGKTVDRHVENIFNKLDVSSRAAATAYGYREGLL